MRPRRLTPRFLEKIWGSTHLEPWFESGGKQIGEVWFETQEIPLLVKFLFTTDKLSVQVHPGDEYARRHHASRGKTEMWHVLAAEPGAKIAAGFREKISAEKFTSAASSGEIETLLEWHEARPGDTFFIPSGVVHAIGGGLVLCEIQQHSDVTYRLYDYGRPRELHLDHGVAVSHLGSHRARAGASGELLVSCPYFTTSRWEVRGSRTHFSKAHELLIVIEGTGHVNDELTRAGEVWHIPAGAQQVSLRGDFTLLHTRE
jgi:mannose-6-phosphate isomerase